MSYQINNEFTKYENEKEFLEAYDTNSGKPVPFVNPTQYPCLVREVIVISKLPINDNILLEFDYNL